MSRALGTQLNDIKQFKTSNEGRKRDLLDKQDKRGAEKERLEKEIGAKSQERIQVAARQSMMNAVITGDLGRHDEVAMEDGLNVAVCKQAELAASDPQTLAGR